MQLSKFYVLSLRFCIVPPLPALSSPSSSSSSSSAFRLLFKRYHPPTPSCSPENACLENPSKCRLIQRVRQRQAFVYRRLEMAPANKEVCTYSRRHVKSRENEQTLNDPDTQQIAGDVALLQPVDAKEDASRLKGLAVSLEQLLDLEKAQKLGSLSLMELRNILRQVNLKSTGRKSDLIYALKGFLASCQSSLPSEAKNADAFTEDYHKNETIVIRGKRSVIRKRGKNSHLSFGMPCDDPWQHSTLTKDNNALEEDKLTASAPEDPDRIDATALSLSNSKRQKKHLKLLEKRHFEAELVEVSANSDLNTNVDHLDKALKLQKPWSVLVHKKPRPEWVSYDPMSMRPIFPGGDKIMKLISWNVNGLRALLKVRDAKHKDATLITQLAESENFDVLCLQETKLQEKDVDQLRNSISDHYEDSFWSCSITKLGYSGSAIISRRKPLSISYGLGLPRHDGEGRVITAEFESFFLVSAYVPNSGAKLERLVYRTTEWDPAFSHYLKELEKRKPVVLTGDLNCAYDEIDIHDPNGNRRSAGFTDEERSSFESHFLGQGLLDTFRRQHPNAVAYTYWGYRSRARPQNKGWRLDYFLVSSSLADHIHDSYTSPHVGGSDHCPIGLILGI